MGPVSPDIVASVHLYTTEEGGREGPTPPERFGCLLEVGSSAFDCRMLLGESGPLHPGTTARIPIKFLDFDAVRDLLHVGRKFTLRELRQIGEGTVEEVLQE